MDNLSIQCIYNHNKLHLDQGRNKVNILAEGTEVHIQFNNREVFRDLDQFLLLDLFSHQDHMVVHPHTVGWEVQHHKVQLVDPSLFKVTVLDQFNSPDLLNNRSPFKDMHRIRFSSQDLLKLRNLFKDMDQDLFNSQDQPKLLPPSNQDPPLLQVRFSHQRVNSHHLPFNHHLPLLPVLQHLQLQLRITKSL